MAEQQQQQRHPAEGMKGLLPERAVTSSSTSKVISVVALLPLGGTLLALSGIIMILTVIALALATPVFILFSPILVPAAIVVLLSVTGFLASGAFGLTAVSSLSWIVRYLRGAREKVPEQMEQWKRRMADTAAQAGQKTKEAGERVQSKAHDVRG